MSFSSLFFFRSPYVRTAFAFCDFHSRFRRILLTLCERNATIRMNAKDNKKGVRKSIHTPADALRPCHESPHHGST